MGDLFNGITGAGGAVGLFIAVVLGVLGAMLRRFDRGSTDVVAGYSGLTTVLTAAREAADKRADVALEALRSAEAALVLERTLRIRAQEYAYNLESDHGLPHRVWAEGGDLA